MSLKFSDSAEFRSRLGRHIIFDPAGRPIGRDGRIRVNYFVNLLHAVHWDENLVFFSDIFSDYIRSVVAEFEELQCVIGPKLGNALLVKDVSRRLRKRSGFVRYDILFGSFLEGRVHSGDRAILIDDIASDGEVLYEGVENLKQEGVYVQGVYSLVDRTEGDAVNILKRAGIYYGFALRLSDSELQEIKASSAI